MKPGAHNCPARFVPSRSSRDDKALTQSPFHTLTNDNTHSFFPNTARNPSTNRSRRGHEALTQSPFHTLTNANTRSFSPNAASNPAPSKSRSSRGNEALTQSPFHTLTHDNTRSFFGVRLNGGKKNGVTDGTRTRNIQNHNLGLYH